MGDDSDAKLAEIRERWAKTIEGPWRWFGNTKLHDLYLASKGRGRVFVMQFGRYGMRGAQPLFQVYPDPNHPTWGLMRPASGMVRYEVRPPPGQEPYRYDVDGIDHPDAIAIEHSWEDVQFLLAEVDRLSRELSDARGEQEPEAPYVCPGCHAVGGERCAPGCIDAEIEAEHREAIERGEYDRSDDGDSNG